jgi:DNA repair ATPase RecN
MHPSSLKELLPINSIKFRYIIEYKHYPFFSTIKGLYWDKIRQSGITQKHKIVIVPINKITRESSYRYIRTSKNVLGKREKTNDGRKLFSKKTQGEIFKHDMTRCVFCGSKYDNKYSCSGILTEHDFLFTCSNCNVLKRYGNSSKSKDRISLIPRREIIGSSPFINNGFTKQYKNNLKNPFVKVSVEEEHIEVLYKYVDKRVDFLGVGVEEVVSNKERVYKDATKEEELNVDVVIKKVENKLKNKDIDNKKIQELDGITKKIEKLKKEIDEIKKNIEELDDIKKNIEEILRGLCDTRQKEKLTTKLDDLEKQIEKLTKKLDDLEKQIEKLTKKLDDLEKQIEKLTKNLDDLEKQIEKLTKKLDDIKKQIEKIKKKLDDIKNKLRS